MLINRFRGIAGQARNDRLNIIYLNFIKHEKNDFLDADTPRLEYSEYECTSADWRIGRPASIGGTGLE
jgi:hypothetical protein